MLKNDWDCKIIAKKNDKNNNTENIDSFSMKINGLMDRYKIIHEYISRDIKFH